MKAKLIKSNNQFYVVEDSKPREAIFDKVYFNTYDRNFWQYRPIPCPIPYWGNIETLREITHSTEQLEGVKCLNHSDVEEAVFGYSVEKMAGEYTNFEEKSKWGNIVRDAYIAGFNNSKELMKDKFFTIEDMRAAFKFYAFASISQQPYGEEELNNDFNKFIQRFLPKTEWDIDIDEQGKITLI